jgi:tartrate dehydrogenase/decarboxylase/D-malate dehydrogenase
MSLWGSLLQFRRKFDQYINLRPVRLLPGVPCPLANKQPGDIDMVIVRENTEGEYSSVGGRMFEGTEREFVLQEAIFTRTGVDRVLKFAFELAQKRPKKHLTSATKSNGISISMPYWDERVDAMGSYYRSGGHDKYHIDILAALRAVAGAFRRGGGVQPVRRYPVRPGPACAGTIGIAPSANLNPERTFLSLFEPVHGSAPDIYGRNIANPIAMIWCGAMMLDFLGHRMRMTPSCPLWSAAWSTARARRTWAARPTPRRGAIAALI